jgi:Uma2 family endonuclease
MNSLRRPVRPSMPSNPNESSMPALENGDHLDQKTFHERYEAMPEDTRAELIGGIVFMSSPSKRPHGRMHVCAAHWLAEYEYATPGVETFDNATNILGEESEPQPDLCLLISPDNGGQTRAEDDYIVGAPELIVEIASSTESVDLHAKRRDYEQAGVREYAVVVLRQARLIWFVRRGGQFEELLPGDDGVIRSETFPGLWLDPSALLRRDGARIREVLQQGLSSAEHAAFVARLSGQ